MVIGADLGGTFLRLGRCDGSGLYDVRKIPASPFNAADGAERLADAIASYAIEKRAEAIGLGVPGTVSARGETLRVPNLPALNGAALASMIEEKTHLPCFVENDVTMLLTGDAKRLGAGSGLIFGCYIGTGVGGAVMYNGRILRGHNGLCEPGHIPVFGRTERCSCGKIGCTEAVASGRALERLRAEKYPDIPISGLFSVMSREERADFVSALAHMLAAAAQLLDPDMIIMGGGVCAMKDFPQSELVTELRAMCMTPVPASTLKLVFPGDFPQDSAFAGEPGVYGAATYVARKLGIER